MHWIWETSTPARRRLHVFAGFGLSLVVATCLVNAHLSVTAVHAQTTAQLDRAPTGWILAGSMPANYSTGVDRGTTRNGQPSAYLRSAAPVTGGFGTLMQSIGASEYAGKRVRLRAWVSPKDVADWAGLWMRVNKGQAVVAFDNMQSRAIQGTQDWEAHDVVLDVPNDATSISFGILLSGTGAVWMNGLTFEAVGQDVALTSAGKWPPSKLTPKMAAHPVNLDFSQ